MATRPFLVPPGPLSRETAAALTDLAGLFAAFYGRLSLGQGLEGVFGRDGIRLALNGQAFQGPFNFGNTTIVYQTDVISYVDTDITIDADSTVVEQGDWCWQHYYCHDVFTDSLSSTGTDNYAGSVKPWWRLSTGAGLDYYITGIVAPAGTCDGCEVLLTNLGTGVIHLQHQNAGSSAANRIITPTGLDWGLYVLQSARLRYDRTASRWRVLSEESVMTGATSLADGAAGLVPKPLVADRTLYLDGSGDWSAPAAAPAVVVRKNSGGADVGPRRRLNLVEGVGVVITAADDAVNDEIDVTIAAGVVVRAGSDFGPRRAVNLIPGAGGAIAITAVDDGANDRVNVTVSAVDAGAAQAGVVSTGTQTFGGAKTFNGAVSLGSTLAVTGAISGASLGVTGNVTGGGTLSGFTTIDASTGFSVNGLWASGTFTTTDGKTVTVTHGLITDIS